MDDRKIALVTGAARGIGLGCAEALAEDGYRVVLVDIDGDAAISSAATLGHDAVGYGFDLSKADAVGQMFDTVEREVGDVSVLVNNAGIAKPAGFLDVTLEDFQSVIDLNLTSVFLATQRAARRMVEKGIEGAIVNMSSINAQVAIPSIVSYCASKGGVAQITKAAALALAPHNIRVNAVGPGSIDTAMVAAVNNDPAAMARVMSRTPLGRLGTAREMGNVVAFLASDKASYVTGETIYADGGRLALNYTV